MATLTVIDTIARDTDISFTPGAFYAFWGRFLRLGVNMQGVIKNVTYSKSFLDIFPMEATRGLT